MKTAFGHLSAEGKGEIDFIIENAPKMSVSERMAAIEAVAMREFPGGPATPIGGELIDQVNDMISREHDMEFITGRF